MTTAPITRRPRRSILPIVLVTPAVVLLVLFTYAPAVYAFVLSLLKNHVSGGLLGTTTERVFAGLENYIATLTDSEFWASLGRMLLVAAVIVVNLLVDLLYGIIDPRIRES